jgi:RNA-binding protein PNO1
MVGVEQKVTAAEVSAAAAAVPSKLATAAAALPPKPQFRALKASEAAAAGSTRASFRRIPVPPNRLTPLKTQWMEVYEPVVTQLKLQIRMNLRTKSVELKNSPETMDSGALQKGADFVRAFLMGFAIRDAIALIRLDDLYLETFEVQDVRATLKGDHLARAVGRIAGKEGRTKHTIENSCRVRVVVADTKIHILGSYENTRLARHAIGSLIIGAAPGKVYNKLRNVSSRLNERF